jgi:H+-transporting ATPase
MASLASANGGQDPVDEAIGGAAKEKSEPDSPKLVKFIPFDPARKMSEAMATSRNGQSLRIVKGAYGMVSVLAQASATGAGSLGSPEADELEKKMVRTIAMRPLPITAVVSTLVAALPFAFLLDLIKVPVFRRFQIA